jgi:hypothetical protein
MTTLHDVVLVNILQDAVNTIAVPGISKVHFDAGRQGQILERLSELDNSPNYKGFKYPLIAAVLPVRERRGLPYYATAVIDRIVIATHSKGFDGSERVMSRYQESGTYLNILYPVYYAFLRSLAMNPNIIGMEPNSFIHTKMDNPGHQPIGQGLSDFVDTIEILNLELTLNQTKTC